MDKLKNMPQRIDNRPYTLRNASGYNALPSELHGLYVSFTKIVGSNLAVFKHML